MKLIFPIDLYKKLRAYVEGIKYEISGLGKIEVLDNDIYVVNLQIFKQVVTGGNTILNKRALGKFYDELMKKDEDLSKWKLWWHSHAEMGVGWSSIDEATIEDFDNEMPRDNWMVSLVTNHNAKNLVRVDIFAPLRCTIDDIDWDISFNDRKMEESVKDEITEKVIIQVPKSRRVYDKKSMKWPVYKNGRKTYTTSRGNGESLAQSEETGIVLPEDDEFNVPKLPMGER